MHLPCIFPPSDRFPPTGTSHTSAFRYISTHYRENIARNQQTKALIYTAVGNHKVPGEHFQTHIPCLQYEHTAKSFGFGFFFLFPFFFQTQVYLLTYKSLETIRKHFKNKLCTNTQLSTCLAEIQISVNRFKLSKDWGKLSKQEFMGLSSVTSNILSTSTALFGDHTDFTILISFCVCNCLLFFDTA